MSAHTADSQFAYRLPSLSYIDAKWEEPELRAPARAAAPRRKAGLAAWLSERIVAFRSWSRNNQAAADLYGMTDHELMDIGISRADLPRVFDDAHNEDLRTRGSY